MGTKNQRSDHKWRGNKYDAMEEERLAILNEWKNGDATGKWTFVAERGSSIIDYCIANGNA